LATIAALKKGDQTAFNGLFIEYHRKVFYFVLAKTNSPYLAEEVTQLTFTKLWQYRHSLDEQMTISRQIFRIAKTTLIDLLRSQSNRERLLYAVCNTAHTTIDSHDMLTEKQLREQVAVIMQQMPSVRRKVFELSRFEGRTYQEISILLSLSMKAVEKQISRAIKQLRHALLFC